MLHELTYEVSVVPESAFESYFLYGLTSIEQMVGAKLQSLSNQVLPHGSSIVLLENTVEVSGA